jgi:hypothetical protein
MELSGWAQGVTMDSVERQGSEQGAGGNIAPREGAPLPAFLKIAFAAIVAGCGFCFLMFLHGAAGRAGRGALAQAMDAATQTSAVLMYAVTALVVIYGVIAVAGALRQRE